MDIIGGLAAIKQTLDITRELRNIDSKISDATFKLRISDIIDKLLEAKEALQDAQERESDLRNRISDLQLKLNQRSNLKDENGLLYEIESEGNKIGEPYCNHCYVKEEKLFRMRHHAARQGAYAFYKCDNCGVTIITGPALPSPPRNREGKSWL